MQVYGDLSCTQNPKSTTTPSLYILPCILLPPDGGESNTTAELVQSPQQLTGARGFIGVYFHLKRYNIA